MILIIRIAEKLEEFIMISCHFELEKILFKLKLDSHMVWVLGSENMKLI